MSIPEEVRNRYRDLCDEGSTTSLCIQYHQEELGFFAESNASILERVESWNTLNLFYRDCRRIDHELNEIDLKYPR